MWPGSEENLTQHLEEPWFEPSYLEKFETHCQSVDLLALSAFWNNLQKVAECTGIVIDVIFCLKYYERTNIHTYAAAAFRYSSLVDRNLPDHVHLEGKTCRATLLNQHDLNLYPDGISVVLKCNHILYLEVDNKSLTLP